MRSWFTCKVRYQKEDGQGKLTKVTEPYLLDAMTFTEAETRIYEEMEHTIRGEFIVTSITKNKIAEIFNYDDADTWYMAKVSYIDVDEESGKEKKVTQQMLVAASSLKEAIERLEENLSTMLVPTKIIAMAETPLIEIFPYIGEEEETEE